MKYVFTTFLLLSLNAWGQPSWSTPATTNTPGNNAYSGARYDPWQQKLMGWWRSPKTPNNIYSDSLQVFDSVNNLWTELSFNGAADQNGTGVVDTATMPGSGHIGGNMAYDWRHDVFVVHARLAGGGAQNGYDRTSLYTWLDSKDSPSSSYPTGGPWHRQLTSTTPERVDGSMVFNPLNNNMVEFGGSINYSPVNTMSTYTLSTNTLAPVTYANTPPSIRAAVGMWFDYSYSDSHTGESRIGVYGGYVAGGAAATDLNYFYPNGSASLGLAPNSWQLNVPTTGSGPSMTYGWALDYDTLRDVVWAYKDSTHVSGFNVVTSTWVDYSVTSGPTSCPQGESANDCNMVYDVANDRLLLTAGTGARLTYTLDLSTLVPKTRTCGSGYSTSATSTFVQRFLPYPALNTQYSDPMGACVKRVSTAAGTNDNAVPTYATINPLDSSKRYLLLVNGRILDSANNYQDLGVSVYDHLRNAIWYRTTPATISGIGNNAFGTNTNTFVKCTVSPTGGRPGSLSCSVVADLSQDYATCGASESLQQVSQMDHDQNDTYAVLACTRKSDSKNVMIVLNLKTGVHGVEMVIPPVGGGGCSPGFGPNFAWTGYLARYVLVDWGLPNTGNGRYCGLEAYNLANAANPAGSWDFLGQVAPDGTHGDLAVYNGQEYFVAYAAGQSWTGFVGTISRCVVPDGWSQPNHAGCTAMLNRPWGGHISAHAYANTGPPFVVFDSNDIFSTQAIDEKWDPYRQEIVQLFMDSTPASPHLTRLAHHYSDGGFIEPHCAVFSNYWAQPHSTLSIDGSQVYFGSSWGPKCSAETYMLSLAAAPTPPPLTTSACDLNSDGVINLLDVQIAITQALAAAPCGGVGPTGGGACNVVDIQRIVNASLGASCRTGG